ncbi:MAG: cytochrome b5 domain-containing protein [Wenzhouxiangella sp.]
MKKTIFALFIAFWASVLTIAALHGLSADGRDEQSGDAGLPSFSWAEIEQHNTLDSCWKVIEGKVYDFTDYIPQHPTPARIMAAWCGRESTEAMRTKGIGRDHSAAAWAMIRPYLIGELAAD